MLSLAAAPHPHYRRAEYIRSDALRRHGYEVLDLAYGDDWARAARAGAGARCRAILGQPCMAACVLRAPCRAAMTAAAEPGARSGLGWCVRVVGLCVVMEADAGGGRFRACSQGAVATVGACLQAGGSSGGLSRVHVVLGPDRLRARAEALV